MIFIGHGFGPLALIVVVLGLFVLFGPLGPMLLVFLLPPLLLVGLFMLLSGRRSGRHLPTGGWDVPVETAPPPVFEDVRRAAQEDLLALADDIRALDLDIEMPDAPAEAKQDYAAALDAYERARSAFDRARRPEDLEAVSEAVGDGRFAIASTQARLEGRPPPERRPPCFFDPRHGPSVRDVEWAPPGGTPRPVPACAADAIRIEEGERPLARQVLVHGERRPYWDAPPAFGPWAGGFFAGSGAAFLPALFFGSLLGSGFAAGSFALGEDEVYELGGEWEDAGF
ncbi:MAG: hypothetical protein ICV64_08870 [Thermoleophilia bacterium]|nr:hypothetical protein [Thermoleophilia bacterium]